MVKEGHACPYMIEVLIPLFLVVSGNWQLSQSMKLHHVDGG